MGITREEFATLVKGINSVFPDCIKDKDAFDVWYLLLNDLSYEVLSTAIHKYMMTEKFPPKPADIRRLSVSVTQPEALTELEAWSIARKAIWSVDRFNPQKEFDKLPDLVKKAIGSASNLCEWAYNTKDSSMEDVISSHFMRAYRTVVERENKDMQIHPIVAQRIEEMRTKALEVHDDK